MPFKEKVNEYTSKASNLFKRTPAPTAAVAPVAPTAELSAPAAAPRVKARATSGTLTARPSAPKFGSTSRWEGWKYGAPTAEPTLVAPPAQPGLSAALEARAKAGTGAAAPSAPARTLRVKARAGSMARTLTAPPVAPPPSPPSGSTFKWGGWKYDDALKPEGTTPKPEVKPEVKPKVTTPKPRGKSGKSFRPGRTTSLASKMAGKVGVLGMTLGTISDLFPSKEDSSRSDALWRIQKRMGYGYRPSEQELREEINPTIFKQGGTVNKLDYINKLNGECPEGYTAVKFAKGGVICTTCQKNKEVAAKKKNHLDSIKEEMKCGGKMKSHQKGGEMTNAQYKKAPLSKKVDQDLKDQATGKNAGEGGTPNTDSTKVAPKKLIKKPTKK